MSGRLINLDSTESLTAVTRTILVGIPHLSRHEVRSYKLVCDDPSNSDRIRHVNFEVKCVVDDKLVAMTGRASVKRSGEGDTAPWLPMLLDLDLAEGKGTVSCGFDFETVCGKVLVIRCVPMESYQPRSRA